MQNSIDRHTALESVASETGLSFRRKYDGLRIVSLEVQPEAAILSGSNTAIPINPGTTEVEDYKYGFSDDQGVTDKGFVVTF